MYSINAALGSVAASSASIGAAAGDQTNKQALLYSQQTGDATGGADVADVASQLQQTNQLLASVSNGYLGTNLDIFA